ncbi:MAG: energy transducer TonB [Desulfurivibrionaceae bacterium]|nr:TonB family protein [Desulfurivibrionaceae bacterium]PKN22998.1 MAG: hypothetical protein CVU68_02440 [Deltaproteobacteria bacterium HGW-Deltaproteobacteria-3]
MTMSVHHAAFGVAISVHALLLLGQGNVVRLPSPAAPLSRIAIELRTAPIRASKTVESVSAPRQLRQQETKPTTAKPLPDKAGVSPVPVKAENQPSLAGQPQMGEATSAAAGLETVPAAAPKPAPRLPEEYLAQVRTQVEARKFYPSMARQLKMQGTVVVAAAISRDGVLRSAEVRASSGSQQLDHAAVKAVMHASPFAAPVDFGLDAVTVDIPLTFKLL